MVNIRRRIVKVVAEAFTDNYKFVGVIGRACPCVIAHWQVRDIKAAPSQIDAAAARTRLSDDCQKFAADSGSAFVFPLISLLKYVLSRSRSWSLARSDRVLTAGKLTPTASAVSRKECPSTSCKTKTTLNAGHNSCNASVSSSRNSEL